MDWSRRPSDGMLPKSFSCIQIDSSIPFTGVAYNFIVLNCWCKMYRYIFDHLVCKWPLLSNYLVAHTCISNCVIEHYYHFYLRRQKEVMFLVRSVCLFVCLFVCLSVCPSDYSQTCERILTKFFGGVGHGSRTKWYTFGGDPDHASYPGVQSPKSGSRIGGGLFSVSAFLFYIMQLP